MCAATAASATAFAAVSHLSFISALKASSQQGMGFPSYVVQFAWSTYASKPICPYVLSAMPDHTRPVYLIAYGVPGDGDNKMHTDHDNHSKTCKACREGTTTQEKSFPKFTDSDHVFCFNCKLPVTGPFHSEWFR